MKRKFFHCPAENLDEFRAAAEAAAKLGVTHVYVSELPKSRWQWDMDRTDPYPNWGMMHSAIFKVVPTRELAQWVPQDYVEKNWKLLPPPPLSPTLFQPLHRQSRGAGHVPHGCPQAV